MVYCCVPFCKSQHGKTSGVSFHEFPSDSELRKEWLKRISRQNFVPNDKSNSSRVCSCHFKEEDYVPCLKEGSLPTIFPEYPVHKVPKDCTPRRKLSRKENDFHPKKQQKTCMDVTQGENCPLQTRTVETSSQTAVSYSRFDSIVKEKEALRSKNNRLKEKIANLETALKNCKTELNEFSTNRYYKNLKVIIKDSDDDKDYQISHFLLEQVENYTKKTPRWSADCLKICVAWKYSSPKGYSYARRYPILKLPSKNTILRFVGNVDCETGVTPLIRARLTLEAGNLCEEEKFVSLIIDEMYIKSQLQYDKKLDHFFGKKDVKCHVEKINTGASGNDTTVKQPCITGDEINIHPCQKEIQHVLANNLLCFLMVGLSTRYKIPVAFFFSKQLCGRDLFTLTKHVVQEVENTGFKIVRIVTDNHKVNSNMMRRFAKSKKFKPDIPHPCDSGRSLFLSFDPCHIIKNVRNFLLEREMSDGDGFISGEYIKHLYDIQANEIMKPVRFLTKKHIAPTNFEKMNVKRATQLFSSEVTSAIELLEKVAHVHPKAACFHGANSTVKFLNYFRKWFDIHNVGNRTSYITTNDSNKMHFFSITDERLDWLENDFLSYIDTVRCSSEIDGKSFLSQETYDALIVTTRSTVKCTKYLLQSGFHFVLTKCFLSDPLELLFSSLRQMAGANDMLDSRAVIFAINHILKSGIAMSSTAANVTNSTRPKLVTTEVICSTKKVSSKIEPSCKAKNILGEIKKQQVSPKTTMKSATVAFVGGYLIKIFKKKFTCTCCLENLSQPSSSSILLRLISNQDRGALCYPKSEFVSILVLILQFVENILETNESTENISLQLCDQLLPNLKLNPLFVCYINTAHSAMTAQFICEAFVPIVLKNFAKKVSENLQTLKRVQNKPQNRKIHKVINNV